MLHHIKKHVPKAHRLAELMCYGALAVFFAAGAIILIERLRGYPVRLPQAPSTTVLPIETVPAGSTVVSPR